MKGLVKTTIPEQVKSNIEKVAGTPKEVEKAFGLDAGTLANLRTECKGPKYRKVGRRIIYMFKDIQDWLDQHVVLTKDSLL